MLCGFIAETGTKTELHRTVSQLGHLQYRGPVKTVRCGGEMSKLHTGNLATVSHRSTRRKCQLLTAMKSTILAKTLDQDTKAMGEYFAITLLYCF